MCYFLLKVVCHLTFFGEYLPFILGKQTYAHKFMLAFRCPYLHTLVQSTLQNPIVHIPENVNSETNNNNDNNNNTSKESTNNNNNENNNNVNMINYVEVIIPNVPHDVFLLVLRYIYSGEIRIIVENVDQIWKVAQEFCLSNLEKTCAAYRNNLKEHPQVVRNTFLVYNL